MDYGTQMELRIFWNLAVRRQNTYGSTYQSGVTTVHINAHIIEKKMVLSSSSERSFKCTWILDAKSKTGFYLSCHKLEIVSKTKILKSIENITLKN